MIKNIIFVYEYLMFYESKNTSFIVKQEESNFFDDRTQHSNPLLPQIAASLSLIIR